MFRFSGKSYEKLKGVHPALVSVVSRALLYSPYDFGITEGLRTLERQKELVSQGLSQTLNSRHLHGCAIDFTVYLGSAISWDMPLYKAVAEAFQKAADELGVAIIWGGSWKTLKDGPHIELDRKFYPDTVMET